MSGFVGVNTMTDNTTIYNIPNFDGYVTWPLPAVVALCFVYLLFYRDIFQQVLHRNNIY